MADSARLSARYEHANLSSQIEESRRIVSQLREDREKLEFDINSQRNVFNNNYQLNLIRKNITELERYREAMITWIGKQLGLSREEIDKLRLDSQFDMMLAAIDNKLRDALRSRYDAFRATYS